MRGTACLLLPILIALAISIPSATAQDIQPSGRKIASDKQGNAIYQVRANGIEIGYKLIGSGDPLIMIMGLGGTTDSWPREAIEALAQKYQLILPDNRGMGYSTENATPFTYKLFADDIIGLLDALRVGKAHVIGYSMGSAVVQEILLDYPQRVNKAILYATATDGSKVAKRNLMIRLSSDKWKLRPGGKLHLPNCPASAIRL
jgi:pimeloyl-ACP methyl ester carboxylesterase